MSPSESDLRAALHDGEGDGLDVERLIGHAEAAAAQRRTRLLSGAAIVAVVLGSGVGVGVLAGTTGGAGRSGGSSERAAEGGAGRSGGSSGQAANGGASVFDRANSGALAGHRTASASAPTSIHGVPALAPSRTRCPATMPHYALPGGGGLPAFGADGPLFSKPVGSVVVCGYSKAGKPSARVDLAGAAATRLAESLEDASKTVVRSCPDSSEGAEPLVIRAFTRSGRQVGTVTTTPSGCGSQVTNGTAVRYGWQPPSELRTLLPSE